MGSGTSCLSPALTAAANSVKTMPPRLSMTVSAHQSHKAAGCRGMRAEKLQPCKPHVARCGCCCLFAVRSHREVGGCGFKRTGSHGQAPRGSDFPSPSSMFSSLLTCTPHPLPSPLQFAPLCLLSGLGIEVCKPVLQGDKEIHGCH